MNDLIIDVREPEEFVSGQVEGAINIPLGQINSNTEKLKNIPKDTKIIVYCNSGNRSGIAKNILQELGYINITNGINKEQVKTLKLD